MCEPWRPTVPLPPQWAHLRAVPHPTALAEGVNLAATTTVLSGEYSFATVPRGLSGAQAEAAARCCDTVADPRRGFWLGDATGVGKGRTIAAVLGERTHAEGSIGVWVTSSRLLHSEALRDLNATCALPEAAVLDCIDQLAASPEPRRVLLTTYRSLSDVRKRHVLLTALRAASGPTTLVLDEAHAARNTGTAAGRAVCELQERAPQTSVVYSTATAASDVAQIGYMSRLGLWGAGGACRDYDAFVARFAGRGMAVLELIALDLKRRGKYIARTLGGATERVALRSVKLSDEQSALYARCCEFWATWCDGQRVDRLRFFKLLCTALKVPGTVAKARAHLARGRSVIITLQRTCATDDGGHGNVFARAMESACHDPEAARGALAALEPSLPPAPLAHLASALSEYGVVELSGRAAPKVMRARMTRFQAGEARVAITTAAASQGISLHATDGQPSRVHMLLELPWSAEAFTQQCGRSARTGQADAPAYELVVSDLASEARFTSVMIGRLQQMGALTRADAGADYVGAEALAEHCMAARTSRVRLVVELLMARSVAASVFARTGATLADFCREWVFNGTNHTVREAVAPFLDSHRQIFGDISARYGNLGLITYVVYELLRDSFQGCDQHLLAAAARGALSTLRRFPGATLPGGGWSPSAHPRFCPSVRRTVRTLLLCANRPGCALYGLPRDALELVCRHAAEADSERFGVDEAAVPALHSLLGCEGAARVLTSSDTKAMLNAYVAVPPAAQAALWRLMEQATQLMPVPVFGRGQVGVVALRDHVLGARAADMDLRCKVTRLRADGEYDIRIAATVVHAPPADPLPGWLRDDRVCAYGVTQGTAADAPRAFVIVYPRRSRLADRLQLWYPGRPHATRAASGKHALVREAGLQRLTWVDPGAVLPADWRATWEAQRQRHFEERARLASTMRADLFCMTERALASVQGDDATVLRCTPPAVPTAFTCLVRDMERTW